MASMPLSAADRASVEAFRKNVVEASLNGVVLVRFTAEWCGPCKTLAPVIDRAIAAANDSRVTQVVVDIDKEQMLAAQFRIQSVPTVYAFVGGQPVDGFAGARSEREVKAFIDKQLGALPPTEDAADFDAMVAMANDALAQGDAALAADAFAALAREAPDRADVVAGYARALLALGQVDGARAALNALPTDTKDPLVAQARAALALAENAAGDDETAELRARIERDGGDLEARFDLAGALAAQGRRDEAAEEYLAVIAADRAWRDGAARTALLKLMEAVGIADPWSSAMRRKLSALIFT